MRVEISFEDWVVGVFDPTVEDPWPPAAQELEYLTRLFSDPVGVLEVLSDEEIGVGLWSVLDSGRAGTALALNDATLHLDARIACVHQLRALYRNLFLPRCVERYLGQSMDDVAHMIESVAAALLDELWVNPADPDDDWVPDVDSGRLQWS